MTRVYKIPKFLRIDILQGSITCLNLPTNFSLNKLELLLFCLVTHKIFLRWTLKLSYWSLLLNPHINKVVIFFVKLYQFVIFPQQKYIISKVIDVDSNIIKLNNTCINEFPLIGTWPLESSQMTTIIMNMMNHNHIKLY